MTARLICIFELIGLWIVGCILLCGCGTSQIAPPPLAPPASKVASPELVRDVAQKVTEITPQLSTIRDTVESLAPANVEAVKPVLRQQITFLMEDFSGLVARGGKVELLTASVAADVTERNQLIGQIKTRDDKIAKIQDASGQRAKLEGWGFVFLVPGIFLIIVGLALLYYLPSAGKACLVAGGASALAGIVFLTLATFILPIEIAVLIVAGTVFVGLVVLLIWWLWKRYGTTLAAAKSLVQSVEQVKSAGAIDMAKAATIFNAVQTSGARAIVDSFQNGIH